jgi:hypothetical protein
MRAFQNSRVGCALPATRQILALHGPKIVASRQPATAPCPIARARILNIRLTPTKQTGKYSLIARFAALFTVQAEAEQERFT